jgi:hypothetical protein
MKVPNRLIAQIRATSIGLLVESPFRAGAGR